ncbi:16S rRNA (adenine(1518)-N(6)/adenine(1519)-N(6))-dimethyltransferase RsmA [Poritiphilus flavus]|uniref:Ribosomal RNA small subunit methyltransferase A n=1 Tax=Poritiphilus flavus TaxID=2697053 RepID=A0A6L9E7V5_9FLAO|nr:16S rRNA (adenine(1518)-N(6)/adenine(1519)-N(6))-dimethyltransferase RsmA [Poritiphilus flavus]NAS10653.1 16S rRNA (adenine(1518)-N(6)/adenine(1519)-N(6))-dimethyltransferase RsmA [Poritiphilus flavus]
MSKKKKNKRHYRSPKAGSNKPKGPVRPKKFLGQHFLKDDEIAARIADALPLKACKNVLEIGPGTGVLTRFLLQRDLKLSVMELDRDSVAYLERQFPLDAAELFDGGKSFDIIEADFLTYDLDSLFPGDCFAIVGNFPYNISSQIVFKMLEHRQRIPEFAGMFQKEVAERICEKEGSKTYGILSVLVQAFYEAEYLFTVGPEVFVPPPKVASGVLRLIRKEVFELECDEALFFRVVKTAFNLRRKTLRNSLKVFDLSDNLKEDAIFDRRPEQLAVADFIALTDKIANDTL